MIQNMSFYTLMSEWLWATHTRGDQCCVSPVGLAAKPVSCPKKERNAGKTPRPGRDRASVSHDRSPPMLETEAVQRRPRRAVGRTQTTGHVLRSATQLLPHMHRDRGKGSRPRAGKTWVTIRMCGRWPDPGWSRGARRFRSEGGGRRGGAGELGGGRGAVVRARARHSRVVRVVCGFAAGRHSGVSGVAAGRAVGPGGFTVPCSVCVLQSPREVALKQSWDVFMLFFLLYHEREGRGPGASDAQTSLQCLCLGPGRAEQACDSLAGSPRHPVRVAARVPVFGLGSRSLRLRQEGDGPRAGCEVWSSVGTGRLGSPRSFTNQRSRAGHWAGGAKASEAGLPSRGTWRSVGQRPPSHRVGMSEPPAPAARSPPARS